MNGSYWAAGFAWVLAASAASTGCGLILGLDEYSTAEDAHCSDGVLSEDEGAVDCGGRVCAACIDGSGCRVGTDCASRVCNGGICQEPDCNDGEKNGDETDADCGGACGATCGPMKSCAVPEDCKGDVCENGACLPVCTDEVKSGQETDVDCGGPECGPCALGEGCTEAVHCETGVCKAGKCVDYFVWAERFGDLEAQSGKSVAVDGEGNVLVAGDFEGSIQFGEVSLTSAGGHDMFVAKRDPLGKHIWAKRFGDGADQHITGIAVNALGDVYVAGYGAGAFSFGFSQLESEGGNDVFVAKFDASGKHQWSMGFGGAGDDVVTGIAVDSEGRLALIGTFATTINFGGNSLSSDASGSDIFVVSLNSVGEHIWSTKLDSFSSPRVAATSSGGAVVTGTFGGKIDLGGDELTNKGEADVVALMLNASGQHVWSKSFGDEAYQDATCVTVDASGNVILGGLFQYSMSIGGEKFTTAGRGLFLAKLSSSGEPIWGKGFEGDSDPKGMSSVVASPSGELFFAGYFGGPLDFGGVPLNTGDSFDMFVVKLDASGNHVSSKRFGGDLGGELAQSIATDGFGDIVITGQLYDTIDFGGGELMSMGSFDVFLARLTPP